MSLEELEYRLMADLGLAPEDSDDEEDEELEEDDEEDEEEEDDDEFSIVPR